MPTYGPRISSRTPPNDAVYVSTSGDDAAHGGIQTPVRTLPEALRRAPVGSTVAVYGDEFAVENVAQLWQKPVNIQAVPETTPVFSGSDVVTNWVSHSSNVWKRTGIYLDFDRTPHSPTLISRNPLACHPEQVWVGGAALTQVGSLADMRVGTFFYDKPAATMYIGASPEQADVRIATRRLALSGTLDNTTGNHPQLNLYGLVFDGYATESRQLGAVRVYGHQSVVEDCTFRGCSARGLFMQQGRSMKVLHSSFYENGQLGLGGYRVPNFEFAHNSVRRNNMSGVATDADAGGVKINTDSVNADLHHNLVDRNFGHGLWLDIGSHDAKLTYNIGTNHVGYAALFFELSHGCGVFGNWLEGNSIGALVSEAAQVEIAYNTFVNNTLHDRVQRGTRPDNPAYFPYNFPQTHYSVHSNVYVQTVADANIRVHSYEDAHNTGHDWQSVLWGVQNNVVRRSLDTGALVVVTTSARQRQSYTVLRDAQAVGLESNSTEYIANEPHRRDSVPGAGLPMTTEAQVALGVTDAEAAEPNIGWYGPAYVPDPPPEEPLPMTLSEQLHAIELAVGELETELNDARTALATCEEQLAAANAQVAALQDTLIARDATIIELNNTIQAREDDLAVANARIAELEAQLAECDCPEPPVGQEPRLAPLRGTHRWGAAAQPGTLAAFADLEVIVDAPLESRRTFLGGDTDPGPDVTAGRIPYIEVPIGGDYQMYMERAAELAPAPIIATIGHEEEHPSKGNSATWFLDNFYAAQEVLVQAPNLIIATTWMNATARGLTKVNNVPIELADWLPEPGYSHMLGFDLYVQNTQNLPFASPEKQLEKPLQYASQLGVPLFYAEFGVAGTAAERAAYVVSWMQYIFDLHAGNVVPVPDAHLYAPLGTDWFNSSVGQNAPLVYDGTRSWAINKASDQEDTQTPAVWKYGILTNGA